MPNNHNQIEKRLWDSADELRANSKLKSSEYSVPVLGLIFLRYADHKFGQAEKDPHREISIFGQEKVAETVRLCKMNLAVHGLSGDIRQGNTYYEDLHTSRGKFDFVMANPPFNVDRVDKDRIKDDPRFPFGMPRVDNANYLWIQVFASALCETGRAGFVMANSASDARGSELEIRKQLIQSGAVDVMIAVGPNFFYTRTRDLLLPKLISGELDVSEVPRGSANPR